MRCVSELTLDATETDLNPRRYLLLAGVSLGGVLAPLNSTMIAVALPELRADFAISHGEIGWLVSAYLIAMAVAQPAGGRLSDQLGRARVFRAGLVAFLISSLAATFAPTFAFLVLFRTGQAISGAILLPSGMAMLRETVPVQQLGRVNGLYSAVLGFSAAAGPLVGAGLLALGSWRLLFLMNVPIVGLGLVLLAQLSYRDAPREERRALDWQGALLLAGLLVVATFLLGSLRVGHSAAVTAGAATLGVVLGGSFVRHQFAVATPIVEWRLFRVRSFAAATSSVLLMNLVMYTTLLSIPFFIREVQGGGSTRSGLLLGAMSILMAAVAPISGRLSDAVGRRWPALAGSLLALTASVLILAGLDRDVGFVYLAGSLALLGLGIGMGFGSATTAAIESAPRRLAGSASGTNSMMRYVGSILGAGILAGVLTTDGGSVAGVGVFRVIMAVVVAVAALAVVAASMIHRFPSETHRDVEASVA